MTLGQIANEADRSIGWVQARTDIRSVKGSVESIEDGVSRADRKKAVLDRLKRIKERKDKIVERRVSRGEINLPLNRSKEELEEYRRKRDAEEMEKLKALDEIPTQANE